MKLTELAFQCVDAIREADYPHQTQGPDAMLDCIDANAASASQMLDAYEKEHDDALAEIDRLTARVGELEAERRWVSVEDALPENDKEVCVYTNCNMLSMGWHNHGWHGQVTEFLMGRETVTHWMPLPAPPEVAP